MATTNDILALRDAAGAAGDMLMCRICEVALYGEARRLETLDGAERAKLSTFDSSAAMAECERVIAQAQSQE